jgi:fumarate reductase subunit C
VYVWVCAKITSIAVCVGYLELEHRMRARCVLFVDFLRNPPNQICHILRVHACGLSSDTFFSITIIIRYFIRA